MMKTPKYFVKKVLSKNFLIECIQALIKTAFIALVTSMGVLVVQGYKEIIYTNNIIKSLCIGEDKGYIEDLLGKARFEFYDNELENSFYPLIHVIIRCIYNEDESLVAYFVTAKTPNTNIQFYGLSYSGEAIKFGYATFYPEGYPYAVIDGNLGLGSVTYINTYYWEYSVLPGSHKCFVAAILPYGFLEKDSADLMLCAMDGSTESEKLFNYRKNLHPNTFGVMDAQYDSIIKPFMPNEDDYMLWIEGMTSLLENGE